MNPYDPGHTDLLHCDVCGQDATQQVGLNPLDGHCAMVAIRCESHRMSMREINSYKSLFGMT